MNRMKVLGSAVQKDSFSHGRCMGKVNLTVYCSEITCCVSSKDCSLPFQWSSINELDKLPSLRSLQCHNNPFMDTEKNPETLRQLIIAKISQLEVLNKSEVHDISTNCTSLGKEINSLPEELFSVSFKISVCLGAGKVKCWLFPHLVTGTLTRVDKILPGL